MKQAVTPETKLSAREEAPPADAGFDLFKHTRVDIGDVNSTGKEAKRSTSMSNITSTNPLKMRDDVFCFYKLHVDVPPNFFDKLGSA